MRKNIFYAVSVGVVAVGLAGCTLYNIDGDQHTAVAQRSERAVDQIEVLEKVTQAHTVIGQVMVNAERRTERNEIVAKMKKEAEMLGGDAITNITQANALVRVRYTADVVVYQK